MQYRVGVGYDIHRLVKGRRLFLGGIEVPYPKGFLGHSDGDALIHAIADALLGATGMGDIGEYFPDTDPKYRNLSSIKLLESLNKRLRKDRFVVKNIDAVVIAQEPCLLLFKKKMQVKIAGVLKIDKNRVGIKAKTNEGLGELGKKKAIAVFATVLVAKAAAT